MACDTIKEYLSFQWIGKVFHSDEHVAITYDKEREQFEIAYLTDGRHGHGFVRCSPFDGFFEIDQAFERAKNDGALHHEAIAHAIEMVK